MLSSIGILFYLGVIFAFYTISDEILETIFKFLASNIVKSKYNCRKSHERFRKLWAEETAKDEAASCVADIDFTYADARPGLICRLHPTQLDGKVFLHLVLILC